MAVNKILGSDFKNRITQTAGTSLKKIAASTDGAVKAVSKVQEVGDDALGQLPYHSNNFNFKEKLTSYVDIPVGNKSPDEPGNLFDKKV